MMHRFLANLAFGVKYPGLIAIRRYVDKSQWFPHERLLKTQERELAGLMAFVYENVPYYRKTFDRLGLVTRDIRTVRDLEKLPIVTKAMIRENQADFTPANLSKIRHVFRSTSGSTSMPFQYRLSRRDLEYSIAFLFRSRGFGGYRLGDRLAVLSARNRPVRRTLRRALTDFTVNQRTYSLFCITEEKALQVFANINRFKPDYIFSSPLALSLFSKLIDDRGLKLSFRPKAVFTNGEMLFRNQRSTIERVLGLRVFDIYGLDDGGVSANECDRHDGLHIDMERGILEVVDASGAQIFSGQGRILATNLHNYATPFIRYETGDLGIISDRRCSCGRQTPLLQQIVGRVAGFLLTPSGKMIHGTVISDHLSEMKNVHQFQIVQNRPDEVIVRIVPESSSKDQEINLHTIEKDVAGIDKKMKVTLQIISENELEYTAAGKYQFVINRLNSGKMAEMGYKI